MLTNKDMIPIPGAEKFEVREISSVMEEATMADVPAEIYEPVQTLHFWEDSNLWFIETEDETIYDVKEIYCNVPSATCFDSGNLCPNGTCMVATGRLTISSGVAYVDVG